MYSRYTSLYEVFTPMLIKQITLIIDKEYTLSKKLETANITPALKYHDMSYWFKNLGILFPNGQEYLAVVKQLEKEGNREEVMRRRGSWRTVLIVVDKKKWMLSLIRHSFEEFDIEYKELRDAIEI